MLLDNRALVFSLVLISAMMAVSLTVVPWPHRQCLISIGLALIIFPLFCYADIRYRIVLGSLFMRRKC